MKNEFEYINHGQIQNLKVFLVNLEYRSPHIHSDLELIYVLDGSVSLQSRTAYLRLSKNQFALLNPFQVHELQADSNALILAFQISTKFCKDYYPQILDLEFDFCIGSSYMPSETAKLCFSIATILAYHYFLKESGYELHCMGLLNLFFSLLVRNVPFQTICAESRSSHILKNERIGRIVTYLETHYQEKILLTELADLEKLTIPYLSHFFKDQLGMSFQEYLADLRCEKARQLLLLTDYNLTTISMESGFSGLKYLNQAFTKKYECTPTQYRSLTKSEYSNSGQISVANSQDFLSAQTSLTCLQPYYQDATWLLASPILRNFFDSNIPI